MNEPGSNIPIKSKFNEYIPYAITFIAGASYGLNTVVVGQPLDTVKTRMQGMTGSSASQPLSVFKELYTKEGIKGLYRGGLPLMIGGSMMRSAQFGVSAEAKECLKRNNIPSMKLLGLIDSSVLLSGIAGGLGRALVEIPTDFFKIRRQVQIDVNANLKISEIWKQSLNGSFITFSRNTILFASFIVYVDLSKQAVSAGIVPKFICNKDSNGLSPFAKGAICANLAWITCWPIDVIKTQRQSGNYNGGGLSLLLKNLQNGSMFRGIIPGLIRSTIANGTSMVIYEKVHSSLSDFFGLKWALGQGEDHHAKIDLNGGSKDNETELILPEHMKRDSNYIKRVETARERWKLIFEEIKSFDQTEGGNKNGTKIFDQWKVLLDGSNTTKLMRQRFDDGLATWEKKLQSLSIDGNDVPFEEKIAVKDESALSLVPSVKFSPRPAKDGEEVLPHTDISDKSKNIWIVTTAALPWMTGTAVNPLLRAAYLTSGRKEAGGSITLMVPWLELESDRESIYGKQRNFQSPYEQEEWIRTWLRETADMKQASLDLKIQWYTGRVEKLENSIYSMGDITALLPEDEVDICVLEEPEHLNWYRAPGESWTKKFKHVIGIVHTNYFVYAQEQPAALIRAPGMRLLCSWMCRAHCHRIIKLSGTLDKFAPEKELVENVHGCRKSFLDYGSQLSRELQLPSGKDHEVFGPNASPKVYFIGKMLWSKGLNYLMELLKYAEESADLKVDMDMYGGGPDLEEAKSRSESLGLSMTFHGPIDHAALGPSHKIFINPSLSEVLCTTVTEALAMGKFVILPSHPSNDFFSQFPNCLTYANKEEFVGNLYYAMTHSPEPLSEQYSHALSWEAANERFAAAGCISVAESKAFENALAEVENGLEIDFPPLIENELRRKQISTTVKRTRSRFRQFRSNLSQEIRETNVLPQEMKNVMVKELDKRLDLDLDEVLGSPKLKVKLSPAELDKILLELYNNVVEGPGADVLRIIGGGANVGRQKYYMKQQALRNKRLQQQQTKKDKPSELTWVPPEFLEDVGTGGSSSITKLIKKTLKRNYSKNPNGNTSRLKSEKPERISMERDTPSMLQNTKGFHSSKSSMLYSIPKPCFLQKSPPFRSKFPSPLI